MRKLTYIIALIVALLLGTAADGFAQTKGPQIKGNVYGGGENAKVKGQNLASGESSTEITINNGDVYGDVFGAGKGIKANEASQYEKDKVDAEGNPVKDTEDNPVKEPLTYDKIATVYGNTEVNIDTTKAGGKYGTVWGDIYGGAALAIVEGDTHVNVAGGKFAGRLFGGGQGDVSGSYITSADVKKNTYVNVTAGEIVWDKLLNNAKTIVDWTGSNKTQFFDYTDNKYLTTHNIYAGGNIACTVGTWSDANTLSDNETGTSHLTMTRGLLNKSLLTSEEWKLAFEKHEDPHFYAFGGGYGIYTKAHKSDVHIAMPLYNNGDVSGGDTQFAPQRRAPKTAGNTENMDIISDSYGVAWTTVLGILGGGFNGHVEETNVLVGDATYVHRVYGGGLGSYEGWVQASVIGTPNTADAGYVGTTGKLPLSTAPTADLQTTHVTLAGGHIFGDVFGGGAGVAPGKEDVDANSKPILDRTSATSTFTDFTEIARVKGNTLVETCSYRAYKNELFYDSLANYSANANYYGTLDLEKTLLKPDKYLSDTDKSQRAQIFGNVYGGGDVANVNGNTKVWYRGGQVFGKTFGAGLGRLASQANDYTTIGKVTGSSNVTLSDSILVPKFTLASLPILLQSDPEVIKVSESVVKKNLTTVDPDHYFFEVQNNTTIGINFKPHVWDDIYGGGRNGVTDGNATVNINGGLVGNNIFGGGLGDVRKVNDAESITSADVKGNTTVTVNGGQYLWREIADVNGNKKVFIDDQTVTQSELLSRMGFPAKLEPVKDFFDYRTLRYTRDHSIYGGGNVACNVGTYNSDDKTTAATSGGTATVNMNHGLFADKDIMFTDEDFNIATLCRYLACENSENTQFGVFGGGYGANTKVSETVLNLSMGQGANDPSLWAEYFGKIQTWYNGLSDDDKDKYYGGSTGENAYNRYFTARMAKSINVPNHTVLTAAGGGLAGYVAGNTTVTMTGHSGALRVYGGGIGMKPEGIDALTDVAAAALTYGQVGGDTKVDVQAGVVVKNVYGGGAGVESQRKTDDSYVDFPGMAHVLGKTDVTVGGYSPGTVVFGKVYGGGDVANVGTTPVTSPAVVADPTGSDLASVQTKVTIDGGCVFQQVFAGGSGRTKTVCADYTQLGAVYGNSQLIIDNSRYTEDQAAAANLAGKLVDGWTDKSAGDINEPWLWDVVYGGGQNGTVFGNTDVQILGGNLGYDIFGGGWGNKTASAVPDVDDITSADVKQNTNVRIAGGKWCLSQSWNGIERHWNAANVRSLNTYSAQYDPDAKKFSINHNVYGGGNVACNVGTYNEGVAQNESGKAYVYVTKGMLVDNASLGHTYTGKLFEQDEWAEIYKKHASPHFSIFGAGFGVDTKVDNTFVKVDMGTENPKTAPSADEIKTKEPSEKFVTQQSLMDVIGGGYEGKVNNTCDVNIDGYTFMRNAFGGAYYAAVGNTNVNIVRANMDNVFGGGMMGDVIKNVNVTVGTEGNDVATINSNLIINEDVYGANDVAGYVGAESRDNGDIKITGDSEGVKIQLNGGHVFGSVYGGGNGNYLYLIDENVTKVTVEDDYKVTDDYSSAIYRVPLRSSDFPSLSAMSDQQKMVNVISYRPSTMKVNIDFKGNSESDRLLVDGNIFGGGNSATITDFDGLGTGKDAKVSMNVGSHIILGGVYLGSDGDALFESKQGYMTYFPLINNIQLYKAIDWTTPENQTIPVKFLPTPKEKRPEIYKNNIDLYFMPVEMAFMPEVTWGANRLNNSVWVARGTDDNGIAYTYNSNVEQEAEFCDAEIGTFCCGGNRGNMDTNTNFHINFPEGLTITDKIVGGCNNANYTRDIYDPATMTTITLDHTGGFLLGTHGVGTGRTPQIHLTLRNKFKITETQTIDDITYYKQKGNVFGGCYERGVVRGDILLEVFSNMLYSGRDGSGKVCGLDSAMLRRTTDKGYTVASVYGAGYGPESWVRGDTEVRLGDETHPSTLLWNSDGTYNATQLASSCNYIFGGGRQGNVIGNTNVQIRNGRVAGCVVGASYAGTLYGSAQTMVGFPELYYRAKVSRSYDILRADEDEVHAEFLDDRGNILIQKKVYYTKGDLVTATAYNGIKEKLAAQKREANNELTHAAALDAAEEDLKEFFEEEHSIPAGNDWSNVNIQIDKAIYGGGYALADGSSSYTVMKYKDEHKFLDEDIEKTYFFDGTLSDNSPEDFTKYGGNTFVIVGDVSENYDEVAKTEDASLSPVDDPQKNRDHIKLSSSQLKLLSPNINDDMFGFFKELTKAEADPTKHGDGGWDTEAHRAEGKELSGQYMKITTEYTYTTEDRANGSKFYEFTGEGGIYGDGRLSISEGFRICDVIGYGYNGSTPKSPSLMNCIHRFDIARFKDCCISLLGDRDYTSAEGSQMNAVAYSMARVTEILMESAIPQKSNFKPLTEKHSRNYVGLSSAQFDLSAVKSNDIFSSEADAALYHNRLGNLVNSDMIIEGTEDETGGAKKFVGESSQWSYYNVKKWYLSEYKADTQSENSDYYDDALAQVRNEKQFQLRNSATARNMFGIFSGYALNVHSTHYVDNLPKNYYGPVVGVFEVDLIGTRAGEAGGYAYAQNIHTEDALDKDGNPVTDDQENHVHSFLETSGNFVFPATEVRKVVDNCTPTAYNNVGRDIAEGHYWYVTGFKYYYNTTITGYTYDGKTKFFESDNSTSKRLVLTGTKKDQEVVLQNFHWLPRHAIEYYKDYQEYNKAHPDAPKTEAEFAAMPDAEKVIVNRQEVCDIEHYYLTTAYNKDNVADATDNADAWQKIIDANAPKTSPYYNLSLSLSEFGNFMVETQDGNTQLPHLNLLPQDIYHWSDNSDDKYKIYDSQTVPLQNKTDRANPILGLRLADCVNNNGKDEDGKTYYSKHLEDPCVAKIVLTTVALNSNNDPIYSAYTQVLKTVVESDERNETDYNAAPYYILDPNGDYIKIPTLERAKEDVRNNINVFEVQKEGYAKISSLASFDSAKTYYKADGDGNYVVDTEVTASNFASKRDNLYYHVDAAHEEHYVYDITLTIKYIKGPSYTGHIDIKNCALPGEMIRLSHENIYIDTDETSLPHNGSFWTIGPGKKVIDNPETGEYHWELIDELGVKVRKATDATGAPVDYNYNDPDTRNMYYPYNPYVNDPLDEFNKNTTTNLQEKAVSPLMRLGTYHDFVNTDKPDYFIPAYYFMNGYVAQYSFTVSGIDEVFTTTINPEDTLLIHNYHRMEKVTATPDGAEDIKVSHAMNEYTNVPGIDADGLTDVQKQEMTSQWQSVHKRPRVYIHDKDDFKAFVKYINRDTDSKEVIDILPEVPAVPENHLPEYAAEKATYYKRYATDYGKDVEFFLLNNIDLSGEQWTAPANFKGILHGNGHFIKGLNKSNWLFEKNEGEIYNLGMLTGKIAKEGNPTHYHCCYTYDTNEKDAENNAIHHVYRMDGTDFTGYDENDWRTGRVAYDLNEYYLAERLDRNTDAAHEGANKDTHNHAGYIEELYGDGEYRFSRYSTNVTQSEYLRSAAQPYYQWGKALDQEIKDDPTLVSRHYYSYDAAEHVLSHKVDEPRAYYESEGDPAVAVLKEFRPLIDEAKFNSTAELTTKKNDYIFFGQTLDKASISNALGTVGSNLPNVIDASTSNTSAIGSYTGVTHNVDAQNNRIWRAYGFYHSKVDDAFHFNKAAWALHPELTAIDFSGLHDEPAVAPETEERHAWTAGMKDAVAGVNARIFYPKMMDMPDALTSFNVGNENYVTKNLLVYTDAQATSPETDKSATAVAANNRINYRESTPEGTATGHILGHWIKRLGAADANGNVFAGKYLHLVERKADKPGAGETDGYSNDFNAPIPFTAEHAWYQRQPMGYRNNHSDASHYAYKMWEGISLPFTAKKVTAVKQTDSEGEANGEISHFYGESDLHHEYWLRGLTNVTNSTETSATFARPGKSGSATNGDVLFSPVAPAMVQEVADYLYKNTFFAGLKDYDKNTEYGDWYADAAGDGNTQKDYVYLTKEVPYIVAFPGNDYYEFSMEGDEMYDVDGSLSSFDSHRKEGLPQYALFEATEAGILVSDDQHRTTECNGYSHIGTFMSRTDSEIYTITAEGDAFEDNELEVVPFRTYMYINGSSPAKGDMTRSTIYIVEGGMESAQPGGDDDEGNEDSNIGTGASLNFKVNGLNVTVENGFKDSKMIVVHLTSGQLVMRHTAPTGQSSFRLPKNDLYIINGKKVMARE